MRNRTTLAVVLLASAALTLTACDPDSTAKSSPTTSTSVTTQATATTDTATAVPDFVGMGLQAAQDAAQAQGFDHLTSHDASGQDRHQLWDRDWTVCDQTPAAGSAADSSVKIDMGAVKTDETCPGAATTQPPTSTPSPTPAPTTTSPRPKPRPKATATHHVSATSGGSTGGSSTGGSGGSTHTEPPVDNHGGATALCNDGTLSYSAHHRGTCSHHGGVAVFYN